MAAAGQRHRIRPFVVVYDSKEGYFVYRLNLKHLFNGDDDDEFPPQPRCFPRPVARFPRTETYQSLAFAAYGTNTIVSASSERGTMFHNVDSETACSGPDMHGVKCRPVLLPVGDDMFFAMSGHTWRHDHPGTHYEALIRTAPPAGAATGHGWAWRALREPPVRIGPQRATRCEVTAYFVAGTRVWISLQNQGTFSFDTVRRWWRREGAWQLPVCGRAILVPDFGGRQLLFGFCSTARRFCACDIEGRPPAILQVWEGANPSEWCKRAGYMMLYKPVELAYFGGGRFCISRHIVVERGNETKPSKLALSLMAVEVTRELQLLKRKIRCYLMSPSAELGYLL